jgi:hypothetical protein
MGEIQYLAGITDGEGYIGLNIKKQLKSKQSKNKNLQGYYYSWSAHMTVSNTHKNVLDILCKEWNVGRVNISKTTEWLRKRGENVKEAYVWAIEPNDMRKILPILVPHLRIKQRQAYLLIEALAIMRTRRHKTLEQKQRMDEIYNEVKLLNKKGRF